MNRKMTLVVDNSRMEFISELVDKMNTHTILEYQPQEVIVDFAENYWMDISRETGYSLLNVPIKFIETKSKEVYSKQFPDADRKLLKNFTADVVFHIAFKLSNQGRDISRVDRMVN